MDPANARLISDALDRLGPAASLRAVAEASRAKVRRVDLIAEIKRQRAERSWPESGTAVTLQEGSTDYPWLAADLRPASGQSAKLMQVIEDAVEMAGGAEYLASLAKSANPQDRRAFVALIARVAGSVVESGAPAVTVQITNLATDGVPEVVVSEQ
jgi:hypothetical protein